MAMVKKVPLKRVGVSREGVTVYPEIGKSFEYTADEIKDMDKLTKSTGEEHYRDLVNEEGGDDAKKSTKSTKAGKGDDGL